MSTTPCPDLVDAERLFIDNFALLDYLIRGFARHHGLSASAADELVGAVRLTLVADDYAVLRRYQGRCSLRTYFLVLAERQLRAIRRTARGRTAPTSFES